MNINYRIRFSFLCIGLSFLFFFNANVGVTDILPDFLGCVLVIVGIGHLFLINEFYLKAKKLAFYFCGVTFAKFIISFFTRGINNNDTLLLTTAFSLVELILVLNLFDNIFKATELILELNDDFNNAANTDFLKKFISIFIFLKYILCILSEATILINPDFFDRLYFNSNIYVEIEGMRSTFIIISFILVTLFGIFMLSALLPYFKTLEKNAVLKDKINIMIQRVENISKILLSEKLNTIFFISFASVIALFDFKLDGIIILPDFLSIVLLFAVILLLKRLYSDLINRSMFLNAGVAFVLSSATYVLNIMENLTYEKRIISQTYSKNILYSANIMFILSNIIYAVLFISVYVAMDKMRVKNLEYSAYILKTYIPQKEQERKLNPVRVYIYIFGAFAYKSLYIFTPENAAAALIYTCISASLILFSLYKLNEVKQRVDYYYTM